MVDQWTKSAPQTFFANWVWSAFVHGFLAAGLLVPHLFSHKREVSQSSSASAPFEVRYLRTSQVTSPSHKQKPSKTPIKRQLSPTYSDVENLPRDEKTPESLEASPPSPSSNTTSEESRYLYAVVAQIEAHKSYPRRAQIQEREGRVEVSFELDPDGSIANLQLRSRSDSEDLNEAALAAVQGAEPFPSFPDSIQRNSWNMIIPIEFTLRPTRNTP